MSATMLAPEPSVASELMLESALADEHDRWMAEVHRVLLPVTLPEATFWERWNAVRYLAERFPAQLRLEQELSRRLGPALDPAAVERLGLQGGRLTELQHQCDRLAQAPGKARELASRTTELLEAVRLWCTEFELATAHLSEADADEEVMRLLGRMSLGCTPAWAVAEPC